MIFRPYVRHPCWRHESLKHVRCTWFPQRPKLDPKTSIDELYSPFQTFLAFFFEGYPKHFHGKAHQRALALKGYPITPYQTLTSWTQDHFVSIFSTFLRDKEPRKGMGRCFAFTCTKAQFFFVWLFSCYFIHVGTHCPIEWMEIKKLVGQKSLQ